MELILSRDTGATRTVVSNGRVSLSLPSVKTISGAVSIKCKSFRRDKISESSTI